MVVVVVVVVVVVTNFLMIAAEKRRLISSTPHITQKHWATSLSKCSLRDSNTYNNEKYHHRNSLNSQEDFQVVLEIPFSKGTR